MELRFQILRHAEPVEQAGRINAGRRTGYRIAVADRPGGGQGPFERFDIADIRFGRPLAYGDAKRDARDVDEASRNDLAIARKLLQLRSGYDDDISRIVLLNPANNGACWTIFNCCAVAGRLLEVWK